MSKKRSTNRSASMAFDDAARNCAASYSVEYPHLWQIDWAFFSPKGRSAWVWLRCRQDAEETSLQIHRDKDGWFFRTRSNGKAVGGKVQPMFQKIALQCYRELVGFGYLARDAEERAQRGARKSVTH